MHKKRSPSVFELSYNIVVRLKKSISLNKSKTILKKILILTIKGLMIFSTCFAGQAFSQQRSDSLIGHFSLRCDTLVITIENTSEEKVYLADHSNSRTQQVDVDKNGIVAFNFFLYPISTLKEKEYNINIFLGAIEIEGRKNVTLKYLVKNKQKIKEVGVEFSFSFPRPGSVLEILKLK